MTGRSDDGRWFGHTSNGGENDDGRGQDGEAVGEGVEVDGRGVGGDGKERAVLLSYAIKSSHSRLL